MTRAQMFLLLMLSIAIGLTAVFFAKKWMDSQVQPEVVTELIERVPVVVVERDILSGTVIELKDVSMKLVEKDLISEETHYSSVDDVKGRVSNANLFSGEILHRYRTELPGEGSTLAAVISDDKRAVTIRVNDVIGVAGFLLPGNKVDIINTKKVSKTRSSSKTVLSDIKVLAVDQTARTNDNKPVIVRAVTLEVTPKEAEKLLTAQSEGVVQLALRNPQQKNKPVAKTRYVAPPSVTIIKGTQSSNIRVRD
ncbi:Flp pilus assembly protein CpaB [Vibrio sp. SCSIO 43140]|uniref:Flp pilus assembly protein CpaB n=1 Tax=Vibrio sp. SCSIO 43140 TaxID=2819100 RepID=UPI0020753D23|nr:Flp pilus assembly protein CpaB [Vibrio sp. SCSIO 43140]USD61772.1 Flp pilus assembly protein CpaB [Vibrio sp. SCSIO 43140]